MVYGSVELTFNLILYIKLTMMRAGARIVCTTLSLSWLFKLIAALNWRRSPSIHALNRAELVASATRSATR